MPYCHRCRTLTAKELRENDVPFHPNLRSLKDSADRGCEFCFVCWTAFKKDAAKHVDGLLRGESPFPKGSEWTPAIWLNGNQFGHPTSGDSIAVSCGRRGPKSDFWPEVNPEPIEAVLEVYEYVPQSTTTTYQPASSLTCPGNQALGPSTISGGEEARPIKIPSFTSFS